ncbi:MAG: pirin family protein [Bacteroidota bacterium]
MDSTILLPEMILQPGAKSMVGDGFSVYHLFPGQQLPMHRTDPFLMLDYNAPWRIEPSNRPKGVDVHPHRGFETVTLVYSGEVAHADSAGNQGIVGPGEVQWMHAASGVLHKEYQSEAFTATGGLFHMAQLWVNLPAQRKMDAPTYCSIHREQIQTVRSGAGWLELVAGTMVQDGDGVLHPMTETDAHDFTTNSRVFTGPAPVCSPLCLFHWSTGEEENGSLTMHVPHGVTVLALVVEGELAGTLQGVDRGHLLVYPRQAKGEGRVRMELQAKSGSKVLWMMGEPLNEPIAAYGPFVMNTREQIQEAFEDFQSGRFGVLS